MKKYIILISLFLQFAIFPVLADTDPQDWLAYRENDIIIRGQDNFENYPVGYITTDAGAGFDGINSMNGAIIQQNLWKPNKYLSARNGLESPAQITFTRQLLPTGANPISGDVYISFRAMISAPPSTKTNSRFFFVRGNKSGTDMCTLQINYNTTDKQLLMYMKNSTKTYLITPDVWHDFKIVVRNNPDLPKSYAYIDGNLIDSDGQAFSTNDIANNRLDIKMAGGDNTFFYTEGNGNKFDDLRVSGICPPVIANPRVNINGSLLTAEYTYNAVENQSSAHTTAYEWYASEYKTGENASLVSVAEQYAAAPEYYDKYFVCIMTAEDENGIKSIPVMSEPVSINDDPSIGQIIYADNEDDGFSYESAGVLTKSGLSGYYGANSVYLTTCAIGDNATWAPSLPSSGYYEVSFNVMNDFSNAAVLPPKDILLEVTAEGKTFSSYRDFRYVRGWQTLGVFRFNGGGAENVKMIKQIKEKTDKSIMRFDSVRFTKVLPPKTIINPPVMSFNNIELTKSGLTGGNLVIKREASSTVLKTLSFISALYFGNELQDVDFQTVDISGSQTVTQNLTVPTPCEGYYIRTYVWDDMRSYSEDGLMSLKGYFGIGDFKTDMPTYDGDMDYTQGREDMAVGDMNDTTYFYPEYDNPLEFNMRGGFPNTISKLEAGQPVKLAYLGGSITEQNGWRPRTTAFFKRTYPNAAITEIAAGLSGTGSDLGAARIQRNVLSENPDLIFIEFAVNDNGVNTNTVKRAMEGIARKAWAQNPNVDICFIYTTMSSYNNYFLATPSASMPASISAHEAVAEYYNIPSIFTGYKVMDLLEQGKLLFQGSYEPEGIILFSSDGVHPLPKGDQIYAGTVARCYNKMLIQGGWTQTSKVLPTPMDSFNYQTANMYPPSLSMFTGSWTKIQTASIAAGMTKCYTELYKSGTVGDKLSFTFTGTGFGIFDMGGPESGIVEFFVDGISKGIVDRFTSANDHYRQEYYIVDGLADGVHTAEMKLVNRSATSRKNKRDIIGNKSLYDADPSKYEPDIIYIGDIIIIGSLQ